MKPVVSVIIPTYNRRELLRRTLLSLADQTYPADRFEVVVVDDGSADGTGEMVKSLRVPYSLKYVRQPNRGRAAARNAGVRAADADLLIFLDSDVAVAREFVEAHVEAHTEPMRVVKGPVIHVDSLDVPLDAEPKLTDFSSAFFATANVSVARRHFEEAGMFNEVFREYGWEDLEAGDRLRALGLRSFTASRARGYHYSPAWRPGDLPGQRERERQRGRTGIIYYRMRPTFRGRAKLLLFRPVFWIDRLLFPWEWCEASSFQRLLAFLHRRGPRWLLRLLVRIVLHHDYVAGMREGLGRYGPPAEEDRCSYGNVSAAVEKDPEKPDK
ncbi:MAG: glycosyltransferase [Limnochordales bacterium]|nr:MAG: family 2 glycosyl transferase [Bacillota bacterium]